MKLSIIIPCFNEEKNIAVFYQETIKILGKQIEDAEFIFINDGSSDNTYNELNKIIANTPYCVRVISFSRNFGKEAALLAGFENSEGDFVSVIDADLQQNPKYILEMLDILEQDSNIDCVAAYQEIRKEGRILTFFKDCFYSIINKMTEIEFVRSASDFRTLRRNMVDAILSLPENCRFSKGIFSWVGFNTTYIPYEVEERVNGESKWSFWKLFAYAVDGIVAFSTTPLIIASVLGVIIFLISMIFIIVIIVKTLIWGDPVAGFPTLASLLLLTSGIQLLCIGILGQYLAKNYTESKRRPHYIVKKIICSNKD